MRPNSVSHQNIVSCLSNDMDCVSSISTFRLDEISTNPIVLFQNKNIFIGFSCNVTRKLASNTQVHLTSSIVNAHNPISRRRIPVNNQSYARVHDIMDLSLQKSSETKFVMRDSLADASHVNAKLANRLLLNAAPNEKMVSLQTCKTSFEANG